jgi:Tol biopolymer transport system component
MKYALIIFIAVTCAFADWQAPVNLGSNVNSGDPDSDPALSEDGLTLYFCSKRGGGFGDYDIWSSVYSGGSWQPANNLGGNINSATTEAEPGFYQSTNPELYFSSPREGTYGFADIWISWYISGSWTTPSNAGPVINSVLSDGEPALIHGPTTMFFSSKRDGGYGGYDMYASIYSGGWQTPVNLGAGVNTDANEYGPTVTADGETLYFGSDRAGGYGGYDLYVATFDGSWGGVENVGPVVNTSDVEAHPFISADGYDLYFTSNRPGGFGSTDIWVSTWDAGDTVINPASLGVIKATFR